MRERDHLQDPSVDGRIILRDTGFWWGNMRERDHLQDPSIDGRIIRASQHPLSGVLKTVTAASGTGHNIGTATSLHCNRSLRYRS